jgi:arginyl-tRNA synthetase
MASYNEIWNDYNQHLESYFKKYLQKSFPDKYYSLSINEKLFPLKLQSPKLNGYIAQSSFLLSLKAIIQNTIDELIKTFNQYYTQNIPSDFTLVLSKHGFINVKMNPKIYDDLLLKLLTTYEHKIPQNTSKLLTNQSQRILIDYSSPNIAKELHVGHLRSTIIGESYSRLLEYQGYQVLRRNHLGDWGLPLGMLIEYILDEQKDFKSLTIKELGKYYSQASQKSKTSIEFKNRSRERTVKLQNGEPETNHLYQILYQTSMIEINKIYKLLNINNLVVQGESFYHVRMKLLVEFLEESNLLENKENSDDKCKVYFPKNNSKFPLILEKSQGGFTYDTSDLTALKYRLDEVKANKIIYVVDSGQKDHLENIFQTARDFGWIDSDSDTITKHLQFGLVLGTDNKKLSSRNFYNKISTQTDESDNDLSLMSFLEKAIEETNRKFYHHYLKTLSVPENLSELEYLEQHKERITKIAINSIKFSELTYAHKSNYQFNFLDMLEDLGKTALHINYTYARLLSIYNKVYSKINIDREQLHEKLYNLLYTTRNQEKTIIDNLTVDNIPDDNNTMINLLICFGQFNTIIEKTTTDMELHYLVDYLYNMTNLIDGFYQNYRVIIDDNTIDYNRLLLVEISIRMIETISWILNLDLVKYI